MLPHKCTTCFSVNSECLTSCRTYFIIFLFFTSLLQTESEVMMSRLSIPHTHFDLQYVRPDFIMLRVIALNLIMWSR